MNTQYTQQQQALINAYKAEREANKNRKLAGFSNVAEFLNHAQNHAKKQAATLAKLETACK